MPAKAHALGGWFEVFAVRASFAWRSLVTPHPSRSARHLLPTGEGGRAPSRRCMHPVARARRGDATVDWRFSSKVARRRARCLTKCHCAHTVQLGVKQVDITPRSLDGGRTLS